MQLSRIQVGKWYETKFGAGLCVALSPTAAKMDVPGKKPVWASAREVQHEIA